MELTKIKLKSPNPIFFYNSYHVQIILPHFSLKPLTHHKRVTFRMPIKPLLKLPCGWCMCHDIASDGFLGISGKHGCPIHLGNHLVCYHYCHTKLQAKAVLICIWEYWLLYFSYCILLSMLSLMYFLYAKIQKSGIYSTTHSLPHRQVWEAFVKI